MLSQRLTAQKLSAKNTTQKCHNCGSIEKWDAAHDVWHRCKQCNSRWDQDHNSVRNLLDLLCESPGEEKMTDTASEQQVIEDKDFNKSCSSQRLRGIQQTDKPLAKRLNRSLKINSLH